MAIFDLAFEKTLNLEGGYLLHEVDGDNGGMTFAGISRRSWPDWTGWQLIDGGETSGDRIEGMVKTFFKVNYWDVIRGDQIGFQGVANVIYDFAVNAGVKTSVKMVQSLVGTVQDGILGPKTIKKLSQYVLDSSTERLFIAEYNLAKIYRYRGICMNDKRRCMDRVSSNLKFLCGWINRVEVTANV